MSDNGFERILQEIHNQKETLAALLAENAELRRQLADLRTGRGIFVEIADKRFALVGDAIMAVENVPMPTSSFSSMHDQVLYPQSIVEHSPDNFLNDTSLHTTDEFEHSAFEQYEQDGSDEHALEPAHSSTFLEAILVDEFAAAATMTMPTSSPVSPASSASQQSKTKKLSPIDEDEKEALRKELVGSFLLE